MADFSPGDKWMWGSIIGSNADYATAHSVVSNKSDRFIKVGQVLNDGTYGVYRGTLYFDTSSLGAGAAISKVNLIYTPTIYDDKSATDFDLLIVDPSTAWGYQEFYSTANYNALLTDTIDGLFWNTSSGSGVRTSANLSTSWVNKTGITRYGLLSSRDRDGTQPTGNEYVELNGSHKLSVTLGGNKVHTFSLLGVGR